MKMEEEDYRNDRGEIEHEENRRRGCEKERMMSEREMEREKQPRD